MKNIMNVTKNSTIFKENVQKLPKICKNLVWKTVFGLMYKNKFCKNFFFSLIGSTTFKLSDLLTAFLFFRLFDNALMKAYSLCGHCSSKKSSKETKICGVILSKWILFIWRFFFVEPKNELSIFHFLFTLRIIKVKKKKKIENVLEFRQQICL